MDYVLILAGIALLSGGGEALVRGAGSLGRRLGLSPLVIGLTIVSCGTSSPELAASLAAAVMGAPAIAIGNVVGSNIANLALVLGATAIIWPLSGSVRSLGRDVAVMLAASVLLLVLAGDSLIARGEGVLLLILMAGYLGYLLRRGGGAAVSEYQQQADHFRLGPAASVALVVAGIGLLVLGADLLVEGAVGVALSLGVSERVIGLTLVAFGTSLPELALSLVAALRHQADMVLGNLIGSNIFNVLFILGATATVHPVASSWSEMRGDLLVMLGISVLAPVLLVSGARLSRWEGALLLATYGFYVALLFR